MNNEKMKAARGMKKEKVDFKTVKRLLSFIFKKNKIIFVIVVISIVATSIIDVYGQLFLKTLIDDYINPLLNSDVKNYEPLIKAILTTSSILFIGVITNYLYQRLMVNISQGVLKDIRDEMFNKMQKLPIKYFDENSHGDIMSRYTNDTDTLRQMISQSIPNIIATVVSLVSVLISMIYLNFYLTILVIVCVLLSMRISAKFAMKSGKYFSKSQEILGKENGFIEEMIDGTKVIKVFTHEDAINADFDKINDELYENSAKANSYANMLMPLMGNLNNVTYVIVALVGGIIGINSASITLGTIAAFLTLTKSFTMPISRVTQQFNFIIMAFAGAKRIFSLMDEEPETNNGLVKLVCVDEKMNLSSEETNHWAWQKEDGVLIPLKGDVRFKDVTFGYNNEKTVLHDISLFAKPGQKIAFVGATGAGKTTITNLINAFYDIQEGSITYDGIDIKDINKNDLRKSLGMVLQDTSLFTGTILENIAYGKPNASKEECIKAAKLANADSFIKLLPDGYNTVITSNGANLSQGQRQLLSIARCALVNPPVMILDEATSSIDTRTEKIIQDGMDKLMEGRTVFVIAHRLSTIQNAKAIMVLENGKIIERGDHQELILQNGKYYELYTGGLELD